MDIPSLFMIPSAVSSGKVHSVFPNSTDADFDFNRDSDATRVNSEGLIERVGYYGSELVTNGGFDTDSDWGLGATWSIANGKANYVNTSTTFISQSGMTITSGKQYKVSFTISNCTNTAHMTIYDRSAADLLINNENWVNGTYVRYFTASASEIGITIWGNASGSNFSLDNVSVVEVTGDRARLNYEIEGGLVNTKPSLLLEPSRTNINNKGLVYDWVKTQAILSGQAQELSPSGIVETVGLVIPNATGSSTFRGLMQTLTGLTAGDVYQYSLFVKKKTARYALIKTRNSGEHVAFDLDTKQIVGISNTPFGFTFEEYSNGWIRLILGVDVASDGRIVLGIGCSATEPAGGNDYTGADGVSGIYCVFAQLEAGSYPTSYIPTNGSTQTRAAETCNGAGTSSILPSEEGILYLEIAFNNLSSNNISLSDGTNNNRIVFSSSNTINRFKGSIKVGGSTVFNAHATAISNTKAFNKYAIKWKENDFALWCNGTKRNTDTSGSSFSSGTLNSVQFDRGDGGNDFYGNLRDIRVYNTKEMTDSEVDILLTKITS